MDISVKTFDMVLNCLKIQGEKLENLSLILFRRSMIHYGYKPMDKDILETDILRSRYLPILELMLQKADVYGIDFNARDKNGKTFIEWALSHNCNEVISLLKKYNVVS